MGVQFSVSVSGGTLNGIWFYSAAGLTSTPDTIALYTTSGTLVSSQASTFGGAAAGSGWMHGTFTSPPALTSGATYVAAVHGSGGFYSSTANYWSSGAGSGGISNPPLSAPNNAGAVNGQGVFNTGPLSFPATSFNATNYWVDPDVTATAAAPPALQYLIRGNSSRLTETYRFTRQ
jgi:hypothetical protein